MNKKFLIIDIAVLTFFLIITPNVIGYENLLIDNIKFIPDKSIQTYQDNPPQINIISPVNGLILENKTIQIIIKCTDDTGLVSFSLDYGSQYGGIGGLSTGFGGDQQEFIYNSSSIAARGYNWIFATVYDSNGNMGYNYSIFYLNNSEFDRPSGKVPKVEILTPQIGDVLYDRGCNVSVKCSSDIGIIEFNLGWGGSNGGGVHGGSVSLENIYFNNETLRVYPGHNWIFAVAFDKNNSMGYDISFYYYNTSKDRYAPEIDVLSPSEGSLYILGRFIRDLPLDFTVFIGKFRIAALVWDLESHLHSVMLYINNKMIQNVSFEGTIFSTILWDCDRFLFGMNHIKIVATDSFGNIATKDFNCFVINFL